VFKKASDVEFLWPVKTAHSEEGSRCGLKIVIIINTINDLLRLSSVTRGLEAPTGIFRDLFLNTDGLAPLDR
jgi:hypothetical protein